MKSTRSKQLSLALSLIVSLFMSATAACACSHHPEKVEIDASSPHEHSETAGNESHHHVSDADQSARCLMPADECCGGDPALKIFAKSESDARKRSVPDLQWQFSVNQAREKLNRHYKKVIQKT